jgi:hypothetical protein
MPNIDPIFTKTGNVSANNGTTMNQGITAAANDFTGAGANNSLCFTADSTNGSFLQKLRLRALGTNVASVLRIFLNNGSANTSATNNTMLGEIPLPATTSNATGATGPDLDYPINMIIPAGFRIYVGLGTAVAAGWSVVPVASNY